ncbi:MBL fold hydrolase [Candidatus Roizmanbacteria bacterium CG02_land_8_20_14_3_00_36_15]|uniref:MBL fold hydrolase n=2 Tax=Candidatus Roizmaniibacteriota TaxID=1752723 RepID=A0A2M8KLN4_9BACT|nr:MAG: MBL fold hydrolase [Candidatus Roizmanbacteria bacterium CG03_land_8_20_14_0_80_36_21]PIV37935.1 MAG: MBL fold hydrolase [Candidatus Roizmanbacteria bacterium CG02_land_8_20_14_3_00_36_15]PIY69905.1 MAG: MBL fold hydrolase [Candidatus Roizmanbacteria bacterium CG_4_10_14_0_8_um_filter_36_36]PJA53911.1 MAG: MBL fold hydrolase [Candidatus Roizmanbacteria bacterium CG_4_9_14_3_um_filter_36_11]PJC82111.1 MAG: MBL fold hydrolase [Candidatus Roizmanbacteria bacterium CG_4_8_14_3_um_filter_36_
MKIIKYSLGQLQTNCYFIVEDNQCIIIDPADEAGFILEELQRRKLKLVGILATHGHFDHLLAVGEIQRSIDISLYLSKKDLFLIDRLEETVKHFLGYKPTTLPIKNIKNFVIENSLKIGNFKLKIIPSPGHTPGGVCYYLPAEASAKAGLPILFSGDTLFKQGIGRYDFSYCNKDDLKHSLKKILLLPKDTVVYPGHGEKTTVAEEKKNFPNFLVS